MVQFMLNHNWIKAQFFLLNLEFLKLKIIKLSNKIIFNKIFKKIKYKIINNK